MENKEPPPLVEGTPTDEQKMQAIRSAMVETGAPSVEAAQAEHMAKLNRLTAVATSEETDASQETALAALFDEQPRDDRDAEQAQRDMQTMSEVIAKISAASVAASVAASNSAVVASHKASLDALFDENDDDIEDATIAALEHLVVGFADQQKVDTLEDFLDNYEAEAAHMEAYITDNLVNCPQKGQALVMLKRQVALVRIVAEKFGLRPFDGVEPETNVDLSPGPDEMGLTDGANPEPA